MELSSATTEMLSRAWAVRMQNFPPQIEFDYPAATEVVSLTGKHCALDCAHCGGHYLQNMKSVAELGLACSRNEPERNCSDKSKQNRGWQQEAGRVKSRLISGGCTVEGKVPFIQHLPLLEKWKQGTRLNFHVGLLNKAEVERLKDLATVVSFDFVCDDATIQEVFGTGQKGADYLRTYRLLRQRVKVLPHICIGLKGGQLAGEYRALDLLGQEGVDGLVFIVFIPTPGTRYAAKSPPPFEEVVKLLAEARIRFPDKPIFLGCMRPKGRYRLLLDMAAVQCGVNKIVMPAEGAVKLAGTLGLEVIRGEECCAL
ncbi:MAG TPA: radical SAM protein [Desulfobacteria bacterium]|nr:radical SAM protein [Desulfobacteria bacterium]